jgi:ABC-type antimicrobial peptide transport system permease subunit
VVAYLVGRRKREIGIRIALGASRGSVQIGALRTIILPVAVGLTAGLFLVWSLGRWVQALLLELNGRDLWTYLAAAGLLSLMAAVAAWVPSRAASRIDPVRILKAE